MMRHLIIAVACLSLGLPAGQAKAVTFRGDFAMQFNFWNRTSETVYINLGATLINDLDESYAMVNGKYSLGNPGLWQYTWQVLESDSSLYSLGAKATRDSGSTTIYEDNSFILNTPTSSGNVGAIPLPPGCTLCLAGYSKSVLQHSSVPLLTINGFPINVKFWSSGTDQYVNLLSGDGFTITEDTKLQNNAVGNGLEVQLGGAGGELTTYNICFQIGYSKSTALSAAEAGFTDAGWLAHAEALKSTGKVFAREVAWTKGGLVILEERIEGKEFGCQNNLKVIASPRKGQAPEVTVLFHVFVKRVDGQLFFAIVDPEDVRKWGYNLTVTAAPAAKYNAYMKALEKGTAHWKPIVSWEDIEEVTEEVRARLGEIKSP